MYALSVQAGRKYEQALKTFFDIEYVFSLNCSKNGI